MAAPTRGVPEVVIPGRWWDTDWIDSGISWRLRWFVGIPLLIVCVGILIWEVSSIYTAPFWLQQDVAMIWSALFAVSLAAYFLPFFVLASSRGIGLGPDGLYVDYVVAKRVYPWPQVRFVTPRTVSIDGRRRILLTAEQAARVAVYLREHPAAT